MTEEKFHVGVKALILNDKDEILILKATPYITKDYPDHWDLPGGRVKRGDSIEETLRKELKEELGVGDIQILEHFDTHISNFKIPLENETVSLLLIVYKCRLLNNQKFELSTEHLEYKWASINEAKELLKVKFPESFIEKLSSLFNDNYRDLK